jgi:ABC-type multidrug transport system ATPase subunit
VSLLVLEQVCKGYRGSSAVLDDVSLTLDAGEVVVVLGERQSGRSTLLRVAAGIERPDSGIVRFDGRALEEDSRILGREIGYCRPEFRLDRGSTVLDQLVGSQVARRVLPAVAEKRAVRELKRTGADRCAALAIGELKGEERVRVALARALCSSPRLIVIDEPTLGMDVLARDGVLELLRSLADEDVAVLGSAGDGTGLLGADRVLSLDKGRLRGELAPTLAVVSDLARRRQSRG